MKPVSRRRMLQISAAALAYPSSIAHAGTIRWTGYAMGAEVSIKLYSDRENAEQALARALNRMFELESTLSIYDSGSELSQLNRNGKLARPSTDILDLMRHVDIVHEMTDGLFDPTIQRIFEARAGRVPYTVLTAVRSTGWSRVKHGKSGVYFPDPAMGLTFNGIAQGFITDQVSRVLREEGFDKTLVNIGEFLAGDRESNIGVADQTGKIFGTESIRNEAIATSAPDGYRFEDGSSHIISPDGRNIEPLWNTVSVVAKDAVLADGLSTALVLADNTELAKELKAKSLVRKVILQPRSGDVITI